MAAALTVRFEDEELLRRFRVRCVEQDVSMAEVVRDLVAGFLDGGLSVGATTETVKRALAPKGPQRRAESRSSGPGPEPVVVPASREQVADAAIQREAMSKAERLDVAKAAQASVVGAESCKHPKDRQKALGMKRICLDCHEEVSR